MKISFSKNLIFGLFIVLNSCQSSTENSSNNGSYVSLIKFFEEEKIILTKKNNLIEKSIVKDGNKETKKMSNINWEKELEIFKDCDINKPAWRNLYHQEKEVLDKKQLIRYTSLDDKLTIKNIVIEYDSTNKISEIQINKSTKNNLYSSNEELIYNRKNGYSIKRDQKVVLLGNSNLFIKALFLK